MPLFASIQVLLLHFLSSVGIITAAALSVIGLSPQQSTVPVAQVAAPISDATFTTDTGQPGSLSVPVAAPGSTADTVDQQLDPANLYQGLPPCNPNQKPYAVDPPAPKPPAPSFEGFKNQCSSIGCEVQMNDLSLRVISDKRECIPEVPDFKIRSCTVDKAITQPVVIQQCNSACVLEKVTIQQPPGFSCSSDEYPRCPARLYTLTTVTGCNKCWVYAPWDLDDAEPINTKVVSCEEIRDGTQVTRGVLSCKPEPERTLPGTAGQDGWEVVESCKANPDSGECTGSCFVKFYDSKNGCQSSRGRGQCVSAPPSFPFNEATLSININPTTYTVTEGDTVTFDVTVAPTGPVTNIRVVKEAENPGSLGNLTLSLGINGLGKRVLGARDVLTKCQNDSLVCAVLKYRKPFFETWPAK